MKKIYIFLVFITSVSFGQNVGPAGIGTGDGSSGPRNVLWLRSDVGVTQSGTVSAWADQSGNGLNAVQATPGLQPAYSGSNASLNNLPSMNFGPSGSTNFHLAIPDNDLLDDSPGMSFFIVLNPSSSGVYGILNKRTSAGSNQAYRIYRNGGNLTSDISNGAAANITLGNSPNIFSSIYDQTISGNKYNLFVNSTTNASSNVTTTLPNETSPMYIGNFNLGDNRSFDGDIAEVIVYQDALNAAERVIVENYLSQKYAISIGANDFFSSGDAAYVNDLVGIGTVDGSTKSATSGFSDALQIDELNGSLNTANEFVFVAHDNTAHADNSTSNLGEVEITDRWARSWYLEASSSTSLEFRFDFGTAGLGAVGSPTDYVLLYRPDLGSNFTRVFVNGYAVENTDQVVVDVSNISLPSGYYTLGTGTQLVPGDVYSFTSGDWNDPLTWTTDPSGLLRVPVTGLVPTSTDNVTILTGDNVTMDTDDNDGLLLEVNGSLIVGTTTDHDFFDISGNGTISISGNGGVDNFPTGGTAIFADSIVGGTVEILGAGLTLDQDREFNNVVLNLNAAANVAAMTADYQINGDLTITRGILQINNTSTTSRTIDAYGDVLIESNGELNVGTGNARHEFNFYGDFINQGRAEFTNRVAADNNNEATDGIIDANFLSDNADQTIDCFGVTNFYRIEIDKGEDQTYILDINASSAANFNLFGPVDYSFDAAQLSTNDNALGLIRGTVRLNTNVDVPLLNNTGNYCIFESARLWVNGGSATKTGGAAVVPYGTLQVSDGTFDVPVASGITTRDNGNIIVEGGVVTVNQIRTSVNGATNIGGYTQSGGTVNVTGSSINTDYYTFSLTYSGNTFNMSGGILNVSGSVAFQDNTASNSGQIHGGGIFINSDPGNISVTGGTVIMENTTNVNFKVTSNAPFWNVIMRSTGGTATEVDLDGGTSGDDQIGEFETILNPELLVLNDLTVETGVIFDHNGFDVEIGSDFTIDAGADYLYNSGKQNTTTINGVDDATLTFLNRTGGVSDEQRFWNLIIDKPTGRTVSLASGKSDLTGNENNLLRIEGDAFKVLSGTLDQGFHSIRMYADTLVNYDVCTVFNPAVTNDSDANGENDLLKFRDDGGAATILVTADTSRFGGIKLNSADEIISLVSDLKIDYLEYRHGRMNLDVHNLTIDVLNVRLTSEADGSSGSGEFSVEDMFITAGNASDGGLSLYVNADGTNPGFINNASGNSNSNPTMFFFPLGTGTTGDESTSEFTPANIRLASATDDGYITVVPVVQKLATAGPYPLGNDVSDRYWIIDYRDFTTVPKVQRLRFRSVERDDPNGGADGFPANYVPGWVLEDTPYTRTAEVDGGSTSFSFIDNVSATNIRIFFWGTTTGPTNPTGGFDLVHAAYTAGDPSKFVGAPEIFYSRNTSQANWTNTSAWSLTRDGGAAGDYPQDGDIAILTRDNGGAGDPTTYGAGVFSINNGTGPINIAKLVFDDYDAVNNNWISGCPRVIFDTNGSYAAYNSNFGTVEVTDRHIGGPTPNSSHGAVIQYNINSSYSGIFPGGDFGDFNEYENALVIYAWDGGTGATTLSSNATEYPMLWFAGGNSSNRIMQFPDVDVTVNGRANLNGNMLIRVNDDASRTLTFKNNVEIGSGCCGSGFFEFEGNSTGDQTVVIEGNLSFNGTNGGQLRLVNNSLSNDHRLIVQGDITVPSTGTMNLGNGTNSVIDLEVAGEGDHTFTNSGSVTLHRLIVNKGTDKNNSFTFDDSFTINGSTNGTTKAIEIQNGTLVLNDAAINVDLTTGGDDFNIPSTGGLQITQGTASVSGDDSGIYLDGCLIVDGGTLNMDDAVGNGNNYIEYTASGNSLLEISSGVLDVGSQIRPITTANTGVLKYRQTGGDVRIGTQAGPTNNRGMLQIYNTGSEFTYTGGTLAIERHQDTPAIAALYLDPDDSDVTGTIDIFNGNTPAGQTDFGINSTISLADVNINGTNNPTARLRVNQLTVGGTFTINSGATFNAAGIGLNLEDDFVNDGTFTASSNTTSFTSATTQSLSGSSNTTFFNFTKSNAGSLDVDASITVDGYFVHNAGTINSSTNTIDLNGNALLEGDHTSAGGEGIKFSGSALQQLFRSTAGTSEVGIITVENANGVEIPAGNGYNFNINGGLRLDGGIFDIGGSNILFGSSADITPVQPFSVSNMIRTNSSFADKGVGKVFSAGSTTDFIYPMGQTYYTPTVVDFGNSGSTEGTLFVSPANEYHPTIDDGNDLTASGDINNVLQYYWTLNATGFGAGDFIADVDFVYDNALVLADDGAESDYIAARILAFNNPTNEINKFTTAEVDETLNTISFTFSGDNANGISGDYFAGIDQAIPDNVATYTVDTNGGYDGDVYDVAVPGGGVPSGSVVIIPSGFTLTVNQDNTSFYRTEIQDGGTLEIADGTSNHRLGILDGTGDLRIISNGISADLPAFSGNFLSCSGGGLEYAGTGSYSILGGVTEIRNLTLSESGNRNFPNNNVTICGDLVINGPVLNSTGNRIITVDGTLTINSGGFMTGAARVNLNELIINGGVYNGGYSGTDIIYGNLTVQGGTFQSASSGRIEYRGDLTFLSGAFEASTGTAFNFLNGNSLQLIDGNFTGSSAFNKLRIENSMGIELQGGNLEATGNRFDLVDGVINTNGNKVIISASTVIPNIGRANSYINGKVDRELSNNDSFTFPIGSANQWRPASVNNVSVGGLTWEAEYFNNDPTSDALVDNLTPTNSSIQRISNGEYWKISDDAGAVPVGSVTARVGLSWGTASDVSAVFAEREELEVMIWNDALSSWDNLDGSNFSSGHTQSQGSFVATSSNSFSEQIFTLGSTTANNPLPIVLKSFTGVQDENAHALEWITTSELNNDYFELQRSADGVVYEPLAVIDGNGTSLEETNYNYIDSNPLIGKNYYQLVQVDFDGIAVVVDKKVVLEFVPEDTDLQFSIFPNPTNEFDINLRVKADSRDEVVITMYDLYGKMVLQKVIETYELFEDISLKPEQSLHQGIYLITVEQFGIKKSKRVIITK
ncbi:LamG-like jellyroll fold domain-containing protein [Fulvivirga lutimaris]|uniref:LamG-like jellyroll fold domain-containing protein n=1 Tax=Fulvivirga lutimaris TaxID=1819566 RepID=UPI0012BB84CB|nr:LamG-like jellyroll fold domain-containing protein [Fulvivirga lutimaris]MTI40431.1 T9SS type A sorting domain-containing protein [Fulvivirga lutimaris]